MTKPDKLPYMQFFVADWLTDTALSRLSFEAKGFWIDLLCFLWKSETRGEIVGSYEDIANLMGCNSDTVERHILRLKDTKTADVTISNSEVTVINRRMIREERARQASRSRQSTYRQRQKLQGSNASVTLEKSEIRNHISYIRDIWNKSLEKTEISKVSLMRSGSGREKKLITRIKEDYFRENYKKAIKKILESDFLLGIQTSWRISFDWFIANDNNYVKILEDNYKTKKSSRKQIDNKEDYDERKL